MSFKFEVGIMPSTKGVQSSKYDVLMNEFPSDAPAGKTLEFNPDEVGAQEASNMALRLMKIDSHGRKFHSFFNAITKKRIVRLRPVGEVPDKSEEELPFGKGE